MRGCLWLVLLMACSSVVESCYGSEAFVRLPVDGPVENTPQICISHTHSVGTDIEP